MVSPQPLARRSVFAPSRVAWRMPENDVQVEMLRVVQPPDDVQEMPAARSCDSASAWVTALAGAAVPTRPTSVAAARASPARTERAGRGRGLAQESGHAGHAATPGSTRHQGYPSPAGPSRGHPDAGWQAWTMPEPAEEVYARIAAAQGPDGHLPMPPQGGWDIFPWTVVDGAIAPRTLQPPADEEPRWGESASKPCGPCASGFPADRVVWEDEYWVLTHPGAPSGLPLVLNLNTREHLDMGELSDELASQLGRISVRLVRIIESLPNIGRVHAARYGDGAAHFHQWFFARTERLSHVLGSPTLDWDEIIPPGPEDVWRADLHTVAVKLANWGGDARA